jgi:hypothetical protein
MLAWSALPRRDVRRSVPSARTSPWCIKAEAPRPPSLHPPNRGCIESLGASPGMEWRSEHETQREIGEVEWDPPPPSSSGVGIHRSWPGCLCAVPGVRAWINWAKSKLCAPVIARQWENSVVCCRCCGPEVSRHQFGYGPLPHVRPRLCCDLQQTLDDLV